MKTILDLWSTVYFALWFTHPILAAEQRAPPKQIHSRVPVTFAVPIATIADVAKSLIDKGHRNVDVPKVITPLGAVYGSAGWQAQPQHLKLRVDKTGTLHFSLPVKLEPGLKTSALFEISASYRKEWPH